MLPIEQGGEKLSRRRAENRTVAICITLPRALLDEIDDLLTRKQSRSAWIADACRLKMEINPVVDIDTRQLMAMLHARINDETLQTILEDRIRSLS